MPQFLLPSSLAVLTSCPSSPQSQRPALLQSLLFEACGRTVNPENGAVGLLWTGNWHLCQSVVETVLRGRVVHVLPEFFCRSSTLESDDSSEAYDSNFFLSQDLIRPFNLCIDLPTLFMDHTVPPRSELSPDNQSSS
ncbi:unnamed protein product [Ilex paraguariensis]|uniref:LOB domain-containing protein n=1 Tax=Ilex paraguariensis TaxID=185542 RepID=A0ABC8TG34_9AQUA